MKNELKFILMVFASMALSGVAYFVADTFFNSQSLDSVVPTVKSVSLKLHVIFGPLFVFLFGVVFVKHISVRLKKMSSKQKTTGLMLFISLIFLTLSGYAQQVFSAFEGVDVITWVHVGLGFLATLGLVIHVRMSKK